MPPKKKQNKSKKEFIWTDDEAELLLSVVHDYKIKHLVEGTCWESVRTKYTDILELFRKELPESAEQAKRSTKDYPHTAEEVSKQGRRKMILSGGAEIKVKLIKIKLIKIKLIKID